LKSKIEAFKQTLKKRFPNVDLNNLNTEQITVYGEQVSWEISNFEKLPVSLVIYNLIRIELAIQAAETATINALQ
jgi:hypothetical protein